MTAYVYKARDTRGELVRGELEGSTKDAVAIQLLNRSLTPIEINEAEEVEDVGEQITRWLGGSPKVVDLMLYARQMYSLNKAGVPITRALRGLADSAKHPGMKHALKKMLVSLEAGRGLASAMREHPRIFSPLFNSVISVGEESGKLDEAHLRVYEYLQFEKGTSERIKTALRYPAMVIAAVVAAVGVLMWLVVPQFARIFERFGGDLPLPTKIVIAMSDFMRDHYGQLALGIIAIVFALRAYIGTPAGRYQKDYLLFRIPIIGDILLRAALARFARGFSMSYKSGVPLAPALVLVAEVVNNVYLAKAIDRIREGAERGESLTRSATATGLFTPLVLQMLAVGEETGQIDDMLQEVAEFYEREVEYDVDNLGALIEPILTVVVAGVVLMLALAVFLPIWDMMGLVTGRGKG